MKLQPALIGRVHAQLMAKPRLWRKPKLYYSVTCDDCPGVEVARVPDRAGIRAAWRQHVTDHGGNPSTLVWEP